VENLLRLLTSGLAALGIAVIAAGIMIWYARDDLGAWYRQLPVAVFAKCPGAK